VDVVKKEPVDNSKHYQKTEHRLKDLMFNKIVDRYGKKGNKWETSDTVVWKGAVYVIPDIASYIIQLLFFWWLAMIAIKYRGDGDPIYGVILVLIFILVRLAMIMKNLVAQRKELEKANSFLN
jgi:hypothetical protein